MHRCTVHGVATTWSIWLICLRFSTLLWIVFQETFAGFTRHAELRRKSHGFPVIFPFGHAKNMSLPETRFKVLVLDLYIPEFGGIKKPFQNDSDIFRPYWAHGQPMGLPDKLCPPQACLAARLLTDQTRRSLLPEEVTQRGNQREAQAGSIGFKRSWPLPFGHVFVQVQWTEPRDNVSKCWGKLVLFTMTHAGIT